MRDKVGYYENRAWRFDKHNPDHVVSCKLLETLLTKHLLPVSMTELRAGDVILMSLKARDLGLGDHLAIYAGRGEIIHSDMRRGVVRIPMTYPVVRRCLQAYRKP
jgi:cell wall-associated NlpC family hydrolase